MLEQEAFCKIVKQQNWGSWLFTSVPNLSTWMKNIKNVSNVLSAAETSHTGLKRRFREVWSGDGEGHVICSSFPEQTQQPLQRGQLRFCETMIFRKGPHKKHAHKTVLCLKSPVCFQVPQALVWIRTRHPLSTCSPWAFKANSLGLNSRQNIAIWKHSLIAVINKKAQRKAKWCKSQCCSGFFENKQFLTLHHPPASPKPCKKQLFNTTGQKHRI